MSGADWLREQAKECYRLAKRRGKYDVPQFWAPEDGVKQVMSEVLELGFELAGDPGGVGAQEEYGDLLHVVLSLGVRLGYDPADALFDAQERNRQRIEGADVPTLYRGCRRPITHDADTGMRFGSGLARSQPRPHEGRVDITPLVIADLRRRTEAGIRKYGRPLQSHNGRDALWDAYEEALDLVQYLRQEIEERIEEGE